MRPLLRYTLFAFFLLHTINVYAQVPEDALKKYEQAVKYRINGDKEAAYKQMKEAIKSYSAYTDAYSTMGEWYYTDRQYKGAIETFVMASKRCKNGHNDFALPLAKSFLGDYKTSQALQLIVSHSLSGSHKEEWKKMRAQAQFIQYALNNQIIDSVTNLGIRINSDEPEMYPIISADTQTLYLTRRVRWMDEDFYKSTVDSCGGWYTAKSLGRPPNTPSQEAAQFVSADGHYLFFMRCENRSETGWDRGGCDLYMAYTEDSSWSVPQSFGATINTPAYEGMPCLSADNRELYFVSDREGGYGGLDIWVSRFEYGFWQLPRNLGPEINTAGDETAPFLHIDNNTLYFASTGHVGIGGSDLFFSRRTGDTTWTKAKNMGYPINTTADEISICVTMDGQKAYISSDRDSVTGNYDIYETKLPASLQPISVMTINGYAFDSIERYKLNLTRIHISDINSGKEIYQFTSNKGDASYMMTLPKGKSYNFYADRIGYTANSGVITVPNIDSVNEMDFNIPLLPQGYVAPINDTLILTLNFRINKAQLSDSDRNIIYDAIAPWLEEDYINVYVNGYTDNTGTPLINEQISYKRAGLVAEYIISMGVDPDYVRHAGWGEAQPITDNETEEDRLTNRRVEVIIRR